MKLKDLIGKRFCIKLGSEHTTFEWDESSLITNIRSVILNTLIDKEFFHNWTESKANYYGAMLDSTFNPMMDNIDETLDKYFYFCEDKLECYFGYNWIDNWFLTCDIVDKELLNEYIKYRKEYAHEDLLDPNRKVVKDHLHIDMSKSEIEAFNRWCKNNSDYTCIHYGMYFENSTQSKVTLNYLKHKFMNK